MQRFVRSLLLTATLSAAAQSAPLQAQTAPSQVQSVATAAIPTAAPAGFPVNLRWGLVPKFIQWADAKAQISWPPDDGCAGPPTPSSLTAGELIDRFGSEGGTFFSP